MSRMAARIRRLGLDWVTVKVGDGDSLWQTQLDAVNWLQALLGDDCRVIPWVYIYHGAADHSTLAGETDVAIAALDAAGCLIIDVEAEAAFDGAGTIAEAYLGTLRERYPDAPIAYSPIPVIDFHQTLPYVQYQRACDAVLPQFYVDLLGGGDADLWPIARLFEQWDHWSDVWADAGIPVLPILPVLETYSVHDPRAERLRGYVEECLEWGVSGLSGWDWGVKGLSGWELAAQGAEADAIWRESVPRWGDDEMPETDLTPVNTAVLDELWRLAQLKRQHAADLIAEAETQERLIVELKGDG